MSLGRTLMRFAFLAAIGHQITDTLVEGEIFEDTRRRLSAFDPRVDDFIHCHTCVGTWVGAVLAAVYRPNLLADAAARRTSAARQIANVLGDAVVIAMGAKAWNEVLGWLRRQTEVKQRVSDVVDDTEGIEVGGVPLPGISLRSESNPGRGLSRI